MDPRISPINRLRAAGPLQAFQQAIAFHDQGRLWEAAQLYDAVLKDDDRHFGALYRLGLVRLQQGKFVDAERLFRRAFKIDKRSADAHFHLAAALTGLDRVEDAVGHYEKALAIKPRFPEAHNNLGYALQRLGRHEEAASHCKKALAINPAYAEARNNLGNALQMLERSEEAIIQFEKALALRPDYAEAHNNLGNVLGTLRRNEEAIAHHERAIALRPNYADAQRSLGNALGALERHEEAIAQYEKALALDPGNAETYNGFGNALTALYRHEEAIPHYEQAIAVRPEFAEAHVHLGNAFWATGRMPEALASYDRAVSVRADLTGARWNRSLADLAVGDWRRGWQDYEARWEEKPKNKQKRDFPQPLWLGKESIGGKRILLHAEQGLGDTLMVARYVKAVADAGAEVILEVPASLKPLLAQIQGVTQILARDEELPAFDMHCPLMSLPLAFGTTLETIPGEVPYLEAQSERIPEWRQRLGEARLPRIGVAWHGNPQPDPKRSIPIRSFGGIASLDVELISLHKEIPEADKEVLQEHNIRFFGDQIRDFSDTAALISLMDLVVSIDTSVAHLAGAMGKPVWILLRVCADWRWLLEREDSVWYPTARLFRQSTLDDWEGVIARVRSEIETYTFGARQTLAMPSVPQAADRTFAAAQIGIHATPRVGEQR